MGKRGEGEKKIGKVERAWGAGWGRGVVGRGLEVAGREGEGERGKGGDG